MTRIILTGRNCDLSRDAFSRAARLADATSPQTGRAALYSGMTPDSAAGGSRASDLREIRHPDALHQCSAAGPGHPQTFKPGAATRDDWVMIGVSAVICLANIALIVLASL